MGFDKSSQLQKFNEPASEPEEPAADDLLLSASEEEDTPLNNSIPETNSKSHEGSNSEDSTIEDSADEDSNSEDDKKEAQNQFVGLSLCLEEDENNAPVFKEDLIKMEEKLCNKNRNDDIKEEVELMKAAAAEPEQLYLLIATDPEYYLGIIEHYTEDVEITEKDSDGEEHIIPVKQDLQSLFNLKVNRDNGNLHLKFKLYPEDKWVEAGYFNNGGDDEETYEEFIKHVEVEINRPRKPRPKIGEKQTINQILTQGGNRAHLDYELGDGNDIREDNYKDEVDTDRPSIGDIVKDRNSSTINSLQNVLKNNPDLHKKRQQDSSTVPTPQRERKPRSNIRFNIDDSESENSLVGTDLNPSGDSLLRAYLNQILSKIANNIPVWLDLNKVYQLESVATTSRYSETLSILEDKYDACPGFLKKDYLNFMNKLKNPLNPRFLRTLGKLQENIPDEFLPDFYSLMSKCSDSKVNDHVYQPLFEPDFCHENLCKLLNLSDSDHTLLKAHNIDLLQEWNTYVGKFDSYLR